MDPETIKKNFSNLPKKGRDGNYLFLIDRAESLALVINDICPDSREKTLSLTKLEEAIMWANAAIARNE